MEIIKLEELSETKLRGDQYDYYDLLKNRVFPRDLCRGWSYNVKETNSKDMIIEESYSILREVSEETYYTLYCRLFNPVVLKVSCLLGGKKKYKGAELLYDFSAYIHSIDDAAICLRFREKPYKEIGTIRDLLIEYVEKNQVIDGNSFKEYGILLGGEDESW